MPAGCVALYHHAMARPTLASKLASLNAWVVCDADVRWGGGQGAGVRAHHTGVPRKSCLHELYAALQNL